MSVGKFLNVQKWVEEEQSENGLGIYQCYETLIEMEICVRGKQHDGK